MPKDLDNLSPHQLRIRAAATAAGMDLHELAERVTFSDKTLRQLGGDESRYKHSADRIKEIADATGAPVEWIEAGWDAVVVSSSSPSAGADPLVNDALLVRLSAESETTSDEVVQLRRQVDRLARRVRALERGGGA